MKSKHHLGEETGSRDRQIRETWLRIALAAQTVIGQGYLERVKAPES